MKATHTHQVLPGLCLCRGFKFAHMGNVILPWGPPASHQIGGFQDRATVSSSFFLAGSCFWLWQGHRWPLVWKQLGWVQEAHILVPGPLLLAVGSPGKEFSRGLVSSSVNEDLDHGIWGVSTRLDILWLYESTEQRPLASAPVKEKRLQAAAKCSRIVRALQHAGTCTIIGGSEVQVTQAHE